MVHSSYFTCLALHSSKEEEEVRALPSTDDSMVYGGSSSISAVQNRDSMVRIVLAGGMVGIYATVVSAYSVMQKYPRLCLARPEYKRSHDSLEGPKELLYPGQKFYLVPTTTVNKLLQQSDSKKTKATSDVTKMEKVEKEEREDDEESVCSAKDFYVSNDKWTRCSMGRLAKEKQEEKKPSNPPITKIMRRKRVLGGWKPTLASIMELSPEVKFR